MESRSKSWSIPNEPKSPFPIVTSFCEVVSGFGRGSAELGVPTANVSIEQLPLQMQDLELGVYFGYALLRPIDCQETKSFRNDGRSVIYNYGRFLEASNGDRDVLPVVLSVGKNPFYHNKLKTVELHILHHFQSDFYGAQVKFNLLGGIRPEKNYNSKKDLIDDINQDKVIANDILSRPSYLKYRKQVETNNC